MGACGTCGDLFLFEDWRVDLNRNLMNEYTIKEFD